MVGRFLRKMLLGFQHNCGLLRESRSAILGVVLDEENCVNIPKRNGD
jgi:hypothetical protein